MKITINGEGFTTSSIQPYLEALENDYGLKVRDVTIYARFVDKQGRVVEPKLPGGSNELTKTISKFEAPQEPEPSEPISLEEMIIYIKENGTSVITQAALVKLEDLVASGIDKNTFIEAHDMTINNTGKLSFAYFEKLAQSILKKKGKA